MNIQQIIASLALCLLVSACDGGGGDSTPVPAPIAPTPTTNPELVAVAGGTASAPVELDLTKKHEIKTSPSSNYFSYTAQAGEKLVIQSALNTPLSTQDRSVCASTAGNGDSTSYTSGSVKTDIIIYDLNLNALAGNCSGKLTYSFTVDGTYIIYADFSRNSNSGFFNASSLSSSTDSGAGSPSSPSDLNLNSSNKINVNPFYNYYSYTAQSGEKLVIQSTLNTSLSTQDISVCNSVAGGGNTTSYTSGSVRNDIIIYDENLDALAGNCSGKLTYTFSADGTYIIHTDFSRSSNSGTFSVLSFI